MVHARQEYEHRHYQDGEHRRKEFSGAHVSLGGIKYAVGAVALMFLGEKIKSPEQRFLVMAAIGGAVGAIDTWWRDLMRKNDCEAKETSWQERYERERENRERERG